MPKASTSLEVNKDNPAQTNKQSSTSTAASSVSNHGDQSCRPSTSSNYSLYSSGHFRYMYILYIYIYIYTYIYTYMCMCMCMCMCIYINLPVMYPVKQCEKKNGMGKRGWV